MFPGDHSGPVSPQPVHRQRGRSVARPGADRQGTGKGRGGRGVRGEARELGTGPGGGQGRGGLLTSTADAVRRRSRVGADREAGQRLSGQLEHAEQPLDGVALGDRSSWPLYSACGAGNNCHPARCNRTLCDCVVYGARSFLAALAPLGGQVVALGSESGLALAIALALSELAGLPLALVPGGSDTSRSGQTEYQISARGRDGARPRRELSRDEVGIETPAGEQIRMAPGLHH
jgi:hypothetical protein